MALEIIGRIHSILQPKAAQARMDKGKTRIVIETQEQFPKK